MAGEARTLVALPTKSCVTSYDTLNVNVTEALLENVCGVANAFQLAQAQTATDAPSSHEFGLLTISL